MIYKTDPKAQQQFEERLTNLINKKELERREQNVALAKARNQLLKDPPINK